MKRSYLVILLSLLAICGSMHAQQVLTICSPQLPCPGFPLGSVQAGVDQNGWRNFKLTLIQNVTSFSFVGTPPPAQAAVNVIFTQDSTGGRTVTFASNISNPCTITTTANATTLCQFEYDGIAGTWFGISSGGNAIPLGAPAQYPVMNSGGTAYSPQTQNFLYAINYGVKGDGVTDDTIAMQNAINAACNSGQRGTRLILPYAANIKVTATLTVTKCNGITIDGGNSQGAATIAAAGGAGAGNAAFQWFGSAGAGSLLQINQTRDSAFKNFTVFTNASNRSNPGVNVGILVDEIGSVTNITTNDEFDDIQIYNGTTNNSSFIGINICPSAPGNCELINFNRLNITCGGGTPTATNNGIGISYANGSAQPFYEYIHGIESSQCSTAIDVETGNEIDIDGGLANQNFTDLLVNGGRNVSYRHIRSELSTAQIVIGTASSSPAHDLTIEENSFAGLTNSTTTISFPFSNTLGTIRVIKNDWDSNATVTPFGPSGGGVFQGVYHSEDNNYPNSTLCPVVSSANMYYFNMDRTACPAQYTQFGGTSIAGVKLGGLLAAYNSSNVNVADFFTEGSNYQMISEVSGQGTGLSGDITAGVATAPAVVLGNGNNITNTGGYSVGVAVGSTVGNNAFLTFAPTSGAGDFIAELINPTINQTGSASGNPTALGIYPVNTAILGTAPLLIAAGSASSVGGTRTNKFTVDNSGNIVTTGTIATAGATLALSTAAIGAHTCAAAQTATLTGLTTSSVVKWSFASTPIGVVGYGDATTPFLVVTTFPTANTANVVVCNTSAASITPGAISLNLRAEL